MSFVFSIPCVTAKEYEQWVPQTDLAIAVASGDEAQVVELISAGSDVNEVDSSGRTALMWASVCTSTRIARILLDSGARVDQFDTDGLTALHLACMRTSEHLPPCDTSVVLDIELVRLLIDAGTDVNAREGEGGRTPLHKALEPGNRSVEAVTLLLQAGADASAVAGCWAAVNVAAFSADSRVVIDLFEVLSTAGADLNHAHCSYGPPIVQAVEAGLTELVRFLIDEGAEVNTVVTKWTQDTPHEVTALDLANSRGYREIVDLLVSAGAVSASDVNQ